MLIKKLAVPFINDKLLQQAEHCYIATAAISLTGFDFLRSRIPLKSKIEIVTGLDVPTSPDVLRKIWRNYHERITLHVYTRNVFRANVYIFDLPFRKSVAFVGSGHLTLEGFKDGEEIFYKVTDAKEIENLKSWFTGYYEFAEPLTETLIKEYEYLHPTLKQRDILSRQEKKQFIGLTTGGFHWDQIKFKNQYFQKEDFLVLSSSKARLITEEVQAERKNLRNKLIQLHESIKVHAHRLKLHIGEDSLNQLSSLNPSDHQDGKLQSMWLAYGPSEAILKNNSPITFSDSIQLRILVQQKEIGIWLVPGVALSGKINRESFKTKMRDEGYRKECFSFLTALGAGYWIEIAGERKTIEAFQNEEMLWEFTNTDDWNYTFLIGRSYLPADNEISSEQISTTIMKEFDKLILLYRHMYS